MRLFKEEEKVQRAKFYPRIIPLANFLTNVSLIIYFANKFSWTNACFKGHFIVQVLMQLQPCGHSRSVLLLKMPDGKFFSRLLFNSLSKISRCIFNRMVYDNKVQGVEAHMRGLEKKLLPLFSEKKQNKKPEQVKALAFLCANKQTKTNEQGKVWVPISFRFTWHFPITNCSRERPISLFNL